ncbi:protein kinase [Chloroflexi bacterium TSY]|nr:protein kinase [Chloroflexi bacterium TSY]
MTTKRLTWFRRPQNIGSDEYERLAILQRTNMSEVWLARRKRDRVITVAKIARVDAPHYVRPNQEAIRNEATWLRKFRGDSRVVQMFHTAETSLPGKPRFIAVEYLDGGTLYDLLDQKTRLGKFNDLLTTVPWRFRQRPTSRQSTKNVLRFLGVQTNDLFRGALSVEQSLQIFYDIAQALSVMHRKGVVHRDIKPDNIMFRRQPKHGRPIPPNALVLIDLGIAAARGRVAGAAISRAWAEPLRIEARDNRKPHLIRSGFDIYSLGRVLRYMLTYEKPDNKTEAELKATIPPDLLRIHARVNPEERARIALEVSRLIRDCLSEDIEKRPSASDLVERAAPLLNALKPKRLLIRRGLALTTALFITVLLFGFVLFRNGGFSTSRITDELADSLAGWIGDIGVNRGTRASTDSVIPTKVSDPTANPSTTRPSDLTLQQATTSTATATIMLTTVAFDSALVVSSTTTLTATGFVTEIVTATRNEIVKVTTVSTEKPASIAQSTATVTEIPNAAPSPTKASTPIRTPTTRPTETAVPTPTRGPTPTPTATPVPVIAAPAVPNITVEVIQTNGSHSCSTGDPDTWHHQLELIWEIRPFGQSLTNKYAFDVVVWRDGREPLAPEQSPTIHGREDIIEHGYGRYSLIRRPQSLVDSGLLPDDQLYIWGVVLVDAADGKRHKLVTPHGCRFVLDKALFKH